MPTIDILKVTSPDIVSETIDGEVVIVNLQEGYYYSLFNTATDIWNRIEKGINRQNLIKELLDRYNCSSEDISKEINQFIETLQTEGLITIETIEKPNYESPCLTKLTNPTEKKYFQPPEINKFTDMEELLLLDPIHEVDQEVGWPAAKENKV